MMALSRRVLLVALAACGCAPPVQELPPFEHYAALKDSLQSLELTIQTEINAATSGEEVDPERIGGLVSMLANSSGRTRELPLEEILTIGDQAVGPLVVLATRTDHDAAERRACIELLAKLASARATEPLVQLVENSPEAWIRSEAAWRLGQVAADWVVPRLILRLKYELDHQSALWIADALSRCGNHSGQVALWNIRSDGPTEELRRSADERLVELASLAGARDPDHFWELWFVADPEDLLLRQQASPRLQREVWRRISDLSGEHFQLRGVDDARFVLSQMGAWVTDPLAKSLHDDDVYVRVHATQCLERMGPRAARSGPTLVAGLGDDSLAPAAAAALGHICYPSAEPVLRNLLQDTATEHELRVACASSLGLIGLGASVQVLEDLLASEAPFDLRQRCAISLCQMGAKGGAAGFLLEALADPRSDRFGAEVALGAWLESLDGILAEELMAEWQALAPAPNAILSSEQAEDRIGSRARLLAARLDELSAQ
ncbi:MAG: HEAT repeat protein [Candidatus Paceibacteria bacterium]|jgi:HEAT repeat protein